MSEAAMDHENGQTRRDFIHIAALTATGIGAAFTAWPFVDQMNPAADTLALASTEVDVSQIPEGGEVTIKWRGKPVFIRHRTAADIEKARADDAASMRDPQKDAERLVPGPDGAEKPQFLVMTGVCTHLGCVPLGDGSGDYGGWFCPCHGSHYDSSGRIRKGPAPKNLEIPQYVYISDSVIKIG